MGGTPFEDLEVDLAEMRPSWDCRYLSVFVCSYSSSVEAYPTQTEKAREVARPLPINIGSDDRPAFVAEIVQLLARNLTILDGNCIPPIDPEFGTGGTHEEDP